MRISAKTRYALSAVAYMCANNFNGESITIIKLSEKLKISKIYLEQVFSLLKRAEIVMSIKGSQGGYQLARPPEEIKAYDIFAAIETGLFEKTEATVPESVPALEAALREVVFNKLDNCIYEGLWEISMNTIVTQFEKNNCDDSYMYYV